MGKSLSARMRRNSCPTAPLANVVLRQSSGQGSGADDLHSVVEYKDADGGGAQQVSVYESVLDHLL